ncbi:MAG: FAD-dependent oxidoreductase [Minisyncoccales bacterium]
MRIAIIGGGICGLFLAWQLSKKGENVVVFEKKEKIGKEVCSGLFSERILDFIPESKNLIEGEINYCLIHFPRKTIQIKFNRRFFLINHAQLDRLVAELAKKSGAKIILGQPVNLTTFPHFLEKKMGVYGYFDKIIGCDGAASTTRKSLGLVKPNYRLGIQYFVSQSKNNKTNFVETWPVKQGFIWKIPRGKKIEYGIISQPPLAKKLFLEFLNQNKIKPNESDLKAAIIPQGFVLPKMNSDITLCGDAIGLTKPWSGGGVVWSLIASSILLKDFPDFIKYRRQLKKFFFSKIIFARLAVKIVYFGGHRLVNLIPRNIEIESDYLL